MIITKETLLGVGGCPTIVQHLVDIGYDGLSRLSFVEKMQSDSDKDLHPQWWVNWAKKYLYNGDFIVKYCEYIKTGNYGISGLNIAESVQSFTNLLDATDAIKQKQQEQVDSENWMFHVHGVCLEGMDAHTLHNCDLDGDGIFDHPIQAYTAFNPNIGQYEKFDTFEEAKLRCEELRNQRIDELNGSYYISEEVQQINDPEENPTGWIFLKKFTDII